MKAEQIVELKRLEAFYTAEAGTRLKGRGRERFEAMADAVRSALATIETLEAELASLRSEREGMREGLRPLGDLADKINPKAKDDDCWCGQDGVVIRYRHIRRARTLLHQGEGETP